MSKKLNRLTSAFPPARAFARDEGGAVAVMLAVMLGALVGMMALAIDLGKAWNLETELQHAADACALTAATQLSGADGARVLAIRAAVSQIARNSKTLGSDSVDADGDGLPDGSEVRFDTTETIDGDSGVADNRDIKFYPTLPVSAAAEATTAGEARFVECNVFPREVDFSFAAVVGAVSSVKPRARAVAGWETLYCDAPPMMMCNPAEPIDGDGNSTNPLAEFHIESSCDQDTMGGLAGPTEDSCIGRGITMKEHTGGGHLFPGEWGFLSVEVYNPETGEIDEVKGAKELAEYLAAVDGGGVCRGTDVTTRPGTVASIGRYVNMRFDIYFNDLVDLPNFQPAVHVGKGLMVHPNLEPGYDPPTDGCRFNTVSPQSPFEWVRPQDVNGAGAYPWPYDGPGYHVKLGAGPSDPNPINLSDPPTGNPITAMSYPRDACAYALADTDSVGWQAHYGGPIDNTAASCVFVPRPGDNITPDGNQIGTGEWDIDTYLERYHPDVIIDAAAAAGGAGMTPNDYMAASIAAGGLQVDRDTINLAEGGLIEAKNGRVSRWEMYLWEISYDWSALGAGAGFEAYADGWPDNMPIDETADPTTWADRYNKTGYPRCYDPGRDYSLATDPNSATGRLPDDPALNDYDRRMIVMAVVNCAAVKGGGKQTIPRAPGDGQIGVFLTEAWGEVNPDAIYGEIVDPRGFAGVDDTGPIPPARERLVLIE